MTNSGRRVLTSATYAFGLVRGACGAAALRARRKRRRRGAAVRPRPRVEAFPDDPAARDEQQAQEDRDPALPANAFPVAEPEDGQVRGDEAIVHNCECSEGKEC